MTHKSLWTAIVCRPRLRFKRMTFHPKVCMKDHLSKTLTLPEDAVVLADYLTLETMIFFIYSRFHIPVIIAFVIIIPRQ